jgi:hypothetical protein
VTTSRETAGLDHVTLRRIVAMAKALPLANRVTLLKGLVPSVAGDMAPREFEGLIAELRLKGARLYDALAHPGVGRAARHVMGERDVEGR